MSISILRTVCLTLSGLLLATSGAWALAEGPSGSTTGDDGSPLSGVALSISTNQFTGAAASSLSIEVPPGRNGTTPSIGLGYSSQAGHGPYGRGWGLTLGRIERNRDRGIPRYEDADAFDGSVDEFVVILPDGSRELVALGGNRYAPRFDDGHPLVTREGNSWRFHDRSGRDYYFGTEESARVGPAPSTFSGTFAWHLTKIRDRDGNTIDVEYIVGEGMVYPEKIQWGGNEHTTENHPFSVTFNWESVQSGQVSVDLSAGFRSVTDRRLADIRTFGPGNALVRHYAIDHTPSTTNGRPLLSSVQLHGSDGEPLRAISATQSGGSTGAELENRFSYAGTEALEFQSHDLGDIPLIRIREEFDISDAEWSDIDALPGTTPRPPRCTKGEVLDLDGDGLPDLIDASGWSDENPHWEVYFNQGPTADSFYGESTLWWSSEACISNNFEGVLKVGLLDINGDARPDQVIADGPEWFVFLNEDHMTSGSRGFTQTSVSWGFGNQGIRRQAPDQGSADEVIPSPVPVYKTLADLNGDGLPDIVKTRKQDGSATDCGTHPEAPFLWRVWWNTPSGFLDSFHPPRDCIAGPSKYINISGKYSKNRNLKSDLFDINGDGLPDKIRAQGHVPESSCPANPADDKKYEWTVWYGMGRMFDGPHSWCSPPYKMLRSWAEENENGHKSYRYDILDVNGDGLPDFVDATDWKSDNHAWNVYFNTGRGFAQPTTWSGVPDTIRRQEVGSSLDPPGVPYEPGDIALYGLPDESGMYVDTFDIDGNGFPDLIQFDPSRPTSFGSAMAWLSRPLGSAIGHPADALTQMESETGAVTRFEYDVATQFNDGLVDPALGVPNDRSHLPFPVWVVSRMENRLYDGAPEPALEVEFGYRGGYFDAELRKFRGFHSVWRSQVFHEFDPQTGLNDHVTRVSELTEYAQTDVLQSRPLRQATVAGDPSQIEPLDRPLHVKTIDWKCGGDGTNYASFADCPAKVASGTRWFPFKRQVTETDFSSSDDIDWNVVGSKSYTNTYSMDACKNTILESAQGSGTSITTQITYASLRGGCNVSDRVCEGICDLPEIVHVLGGEKKRFFYDTDDRLESVFLEDPNDPGNTIQQSRMEYSPAGNLTLQEDGNGIITTFEQDGATDLYVVEQIVDPNGIHLVSQFEHDPTHGQPIREVDANGNQTEYAYDSFGRLIAMAEPGTSLSLPTEKYDYWLLNRTANVQMKATHRLEPNYHSFGGYTISARFTDALGRNLQNQRTAELDGTEYVLVENGTRFGRGGRPERFFLPIRSNAGDPRTLVAPLSGPIAQIRYDAFGREIRRELPDGTATSASYRTAWTKRSCDARHTANAYDGQCKEEETDAFSRVIETRTFLGSDPLAYASEQFAYDTGNRLIESMQNLDTRTRISMFYDPFGRKTLVTDPSSGIWRYEYDAAGNMVVQDDPRPLRWLRIEYDAVGRTTRRVAVTADSEGVESESVLVTFTYDALGPADEATHGVVENAVGRLVKSEESSGTMVARKYDARGNLLESWRQIRFADENGEESREFAFVTEVDPLTNRVVKTELPHPLLEGGVEEVYFSHSATGQLVGISSDSNDFLVDAAYDEFERITMTSFGNGVLDEFTFGDASNGFRLERIDTEGEGRKRALHYGGYDANGNLGWVRDTFNFPDDPRTQTQVHFYDRASRLSSSRACGAGRYADAFESDAYGNLRLKDGRNYEYDPQRPHRVISVAGGVVDYDEAGNMTELPDGRELFYDDEGRLTSVKQGTQELARFAYDHSGTRVAARESGGNVRFFFGAFDVSGDEILRQISLGDRMIASSKVSGGDLLVAGIDAPQNSNQIARRFGASLLFTFLGISLAVPGRTRILFFGWVPRASGALLATLFVAVNVIYASNASAFGCLPEPDNVADETVFYHVDHLRTAQLLTDEQGRTLEYTVNRPYGEVAGRYDLDAVPLSESKASFQFTGQRSLESTGLIYFGARYYDPDLGLFVTQDPQEQYWNPYSYGGGNPVNGIDPDGQFFSIIVGVVWAVVSAAIYVGSIIGPVLAQLGPLLGMAIGAISNGIQAAVNGASAGEALSAAVMGGVMGFIAAGAGSVLATSVGAVAVSFKVAVGAYAIYNTVESFRSGQYVAGAFTLGGIALALANSMNAYGKGADGNVSCPSACQQDGGPIASYQQDAPVTSSSTATPTTSPTSGPPSLMSHVSAGHVSTQVVDVQGNVATTLDVGGKVFTAGAIVNPALAPVGAAMSGGAALIRGDNLGLVLFVRNVGMSFIPGGPAMTQTMAATSTALDGAMALGGL